MGFFLFILVTAVLFLRPSEIVPELRAFAIYEGLILTCFAVAFLGLIQQFCDGRFWKQPLTIFVFGIFIAILLSGLREWDPARNWLGAYEFLKVVVYYLLLVTVVNTSEKLQKFLLCVVLFTAAATLLMALDYHEIIRLPGVRHVLDTESEDLLTQRTFKRLSGTGIFSDPNDICMLFVIAVPLCIHWLIDGRNQLLRYLWMAPLGLFGYTTYLTKSRGGFLAVLTTVVVLLWCRYGRRTGLWLILAVAPLLLLLFAGRATNLDRASTAYHRFELWQEAVSALKYQPIFGMGIGRFREENDLVTHNSFLECYAELGFFGGTIFLGAFYFCARSLWRLTSQQLIVVDPAARSLNPYLLAVVAGFIVLIMTLSRSFIVPTYLLLGIVTVHLQSAQTHPYTIPLQLNQRLLTRIVLASVGFIAIMYVAMRILVRY